MKKCVVLTGAGISADSGLKTFRDAGGLWEGHDVHEVATPEAFAHNPQLVLDFYNARRRQLHEVKPNAAHLALAKLQAHYDTHIITQNVDDLHERAGSRNVLHLHGELTKLRSTVSADHVIDWHEDQLLAHTDPDGAPMRPHIVWFGEEVPLFAQAAEAIADADVVLVVGTSMKVYPAASLLEYAPKRAQCWLIDPNPACNTRTRRALQVVSERAAVGVPSVVDYLLHGD